MTTALTTAQAQTVTSLLSNNMKRVASVLPKHLTPEKVCRIAYMAIEKTPALAQCSQHSLLNAVLEASALGLEIGGARPLAHLMPFKNSVTLIIDYKGFIELAQRSGQIKTFYFQPVYSKDEFNYSYGLNPDIKHVPSADADRGDLVYAYAVVKYINGGFDFEVVDKSTAMQAKKRSPAKNSNNSPWNTDDEYAMWCKTAVRRLAKRVPLSPEFQRAAFLDELADAGIKQDMRTIPMAIELDQLPDATGDLTAKLLECNSKVYCPSQDKDIDKSECESCTIKDGCPAV